MIWSHLVYIRLRKGLKVVKSNINKSPKEKCQLSFYETPFRHAADNNKKTPSLLSLDTTLRSAFYHLISVSQSRLCTVHSPDGDEMHLLRGDAEVEEYFLESEGLVPLHEKAGRVLGEQAAVPHDPHHVGVPCLLDVVGGDDDAHT